MFFISAQCFEWLTCSTDGTLVGRRHKCDDMSGARSPRCTIRGSKHNAASITVNEWVNILLRALLGFVGLSFSRQISNLLNFNLLKFKPKRNLKRFNIQDFFRIFSQFVYQNSLLNQSTSIFYKSLFMLFPQVIDNQIKNKKII